MLEAIKRLIGQMIEAEISIPEILAKVANKAEAVSGLWATAKGVIDTYLPPIVFALILLGLSMLEAFLGKKLLGVQKVIVCFAFGFVVGTVLLHPVLASLLPTLDKNIVGAVVGVIAACLCRPIYFVGYVGVIGYLAYFLMVSGCLLPEFVGDKIVGAAVAGGLIAVCLIFRKIVEIGITSALGGLFAMWSIDFMVKTLFEGKGITDLLGGADIFVKIGIVLVVGVAGFIVQFRTRRRW